MRFRDLTQRQREVVSLVADGLSNPEIAEALFISVDTVKNHLTWVYAQMGLCGGPAIKRIQLARWYWLEVELPFYLSEGFDDDRP